MEPFRIILGMGISFPFFSHNVNKQRSLETLDITEHFNKMVHIMTIYRAKILEPQFFKEHTRCKEPLDSFFKVSWLFCIQWAYFS